MPQSRIQLEALYHQNPANVPLLLNLGILCYQQGDLNFAINYLKNALSLEPQNPQAHAQLGAIYSNQGNFPTAVYHLQESLTYQPNQPEIWNNLGLIAQQSYQFDAAKNCYAQGLKLDPRHPGLLANALHLAHILRDQDAITYLTPKVKPHRPGFFGLTPFNSLLFHHHPQANLKVAQKWSQLIVKHYPPLPPLKTTRPIHSKIHLGYLSYDFRDHVIGRLIHGIFAHHDSRRFKVSAYGYGPPSANPYLSQIKPYCQYHDVDAESPISTAKRIRRDQVDILIDLTGYTRGGRVEIPSLRPCPIQINYLGFPGSMGASFYDYIIADSTLIPPGAEVNFSENILRLPWYLVTSYPKNHKPAPRIPQTAGEVGSIFVFACLSHLYKIDDATFTLWFEILRKVPNSQLWLQAGHPQAHQAINSLAAGQSIDPTRLRFLPRTTYPQYLKTLPKINLALDPPHYNGGGTTADLLWSGVPTITLAGERYVARMSAAILTAAGLSQLITSTNDNYISLAVKLATNPKMLLDYKSNLISHKSKLFDTQAWVNNFERGLKSAWDRHLAGLPPTHLAL